MSDLQRIFEHIAARNKWRNRESRSGDGSTLFYTRHLRSRLEAFVREFEVRTFFDAPCGDFNWMRAVAFPPRVTYIGGDIALSLIKQNRKQYAEPRLGFLLSLRLNFLLGAPAAFIFRISERLSTLSDCRSAA